ncbi:MAG: hypothetical protein ACO3ZW_02955 [Opitutales bacterium]|jgi:hypothetical protein
MKKTAFLQALLLVILLLGSWAVFLSRLHSPPERDPAKAVEEPVPAALAKPEPTPGPAGTEPPLSPNEPPPRVPPGWVEWIDYLQQQSSPEDMQRAFGELRRGLFSMDPEEAWATIVELLASGTNVTSGLPFAVGKNGCLETAPDLQTLLLDWLGQLDPRRAAELARKALSTGGFTMGPDRYVIHLRNFAWGSVLSDLRERSFLQTRVRDLLNHREWLESPSHSVAEAFDFIVLLEDTGLIPLVSSLMEPGRNPALQHAGNITLERLADRAPVETGQELLQTIGRPGLAPRARAAFMARLDPSVHRERDLLDTYLTRAGIQASEAEFFLHYLPNMSLTFSHNLASPEISITEKMDYSDRLRSALEAVRHWELEPELRTLAEGLRETGDRIRLQLEGQPSP